MVLRAVARRSLFCLIQQMLDCALTVHVAWHQLTQHTCCALSGTAPSPDTAAAPPEDAGLLRLLLLPASL